MSYNEIIKGLECCKTANCSDCKGCPYNGKSDSTRLYVDCCNLLITDALDLINRQKAEIERLTSESQMADGYADALEERAKAEAVKEFAEKLKAIRRKMYPCYVSVDLFEGVIDNLVKEFTEGGNDG